MLEGRGFVLFGWPKSMGGLETQFEAMTEALNDVGNLLLVRMAGQFPGKFLHFERANCRNGREHCTGWGREERRTK